MSFLRRGNRRGRRAAAVAVTGALFAFQALAMIGAVPASAAVVTCNFAGGALSLTINDVAPNPTVFSRDAAGNILVNGAVTSALPAPCSTSVAATVANTTAINVTGGAGAEDVTIDLSDGATTRSFGTINWTLALGTQPAAPASDDLLITNATSTNKATIELGASGIDLNGDGDLDVTLSGADAVTVEAGDAGDTINAGGSTATGAAFATAVTITGGAGKDTLTGGAADDTVNGGGEDDTIAGGLGNDTLGGGAEGVNGDTVDYSASATAVIVTLNVNASGEGLDLLSGFENVTGSAFNDTLIGDGGDNWITPGPGDDSVTGGAPSVAFGDTIDLSDAPGPVTVDMAAGTATGNGTDTFSGMENAQGSEFADDLKGSSGYNGLFGGGGNDLIAGLAGDDDLQGEGGVDTVDYSWSARFVTLNLNCTGVAGTGVIGGTTNPTNDDIDTMENAILTADDDTFTGNEFANTVWPNGGQNSLNGDGTLAVCTGTAVPAGGGDTLDYGVGYEAGVTVNMAGGATAGDSAIGFENARGTAFADNFVGNADSNTIAGRGGNDTVRLGSGDDTGRGGPGKDSLFGGSGDDLLAGAKGNDVLFGGGGDDIGKGGPGKDVCRGVEVRRSCGTPGNPKLPTARAARLI